MGIVLSEADDIRIGGGSVDAVYYRGETIWPSAPAFTPTLVTVTATGAYTVEWLEGATKCDRVLCGGGSGVWAVSGGTDLPTSGGTTTATAGDTLTALGGDVRESTPSNSPTTAGTPGESPGDFTYNGKLYSGGTGGAVPNGSGTQPGAGAGGYNGGGPLNGRLGGTAGAWAADTITTPGTITGTVGAGGLSQANGGGYGNPGGDGIAHFWFYT